MATRQRRLLKQIVGGAVLWLLLALAALLMLWPSIPDSWTRWLLLVAFGPPLYVLVEVVANRMWESDAGRAVSQHPSRTLRIAAGVVLGAIYVAVVMIVGS